MQYRLARDEYPEADQYEIVGVIMRRLSNDAVLGLAADVLGYWPSEPPGDMHGMAEHEVFNWVSEVEEST